MGIYSDKAVEYFESGYNCAQAVFLTFAPQFGIDKDTALKLSSSFGGGMGRLREVCGAVSAMFAIAGLKNGYTEPNNIEIKTRHYELIQHLANEFKKTHKTIICRELLNMPEGADTPTPSARTEQYYKERPCSKFIRTAAEIIEKELL